MTDNKQVHVQDGRPEGPVSIDEALVASRTGRVHGFNARGQAVFSIAGPSFELSSRKRRKRAGRATVHLLWRNDKGGGAKWVESEWSDWLPPGLDRQLRKLSTQMRKQLDALDWQPVDPVPVVDMIARAMKG